MIANFSAFYFLATLLIYCSGMSQFRPAQAVGNGDSRLCTKLLPGLSDMSRGVDASLFDLTPLDDAMDDGVREQVVDFTCKRGKTKLGLNETETFQVADQIRVLDKFSGDLTTSYVRLFKDIDDVINWIRTNDGGYDDIFDYAFTDSGSFRKIEDGFLNQGYKVVVDVSSYTLANRLIMHLPWALRLTKKAKDFLAANVTGSFDDNPDGYNEFIDMFGTHYMESNHLGGYIQSVIGIKNDTYVNTHSDDVIKSQAKALFHSLINVNPKQSGSDLLDKVFVDSTVVLTKYYGGNAKLFEAGLKKEWKKSLSKNPQHFYSVLKPVYHLIHDHKKKEGMISAVGKHILSSYAKELKRRVKRVEPKIRATDATRINKIIDTLLAKPKYSARLGKELKSKVDEEIIVPEWFWKSTSLCLQTDSVVNKKCHYDQHSKRQQKLCSKANQVVTSGARVFNWGKSTRSLWGWALQWGITSFDYPIWFEDVQVCVRNRASDDITKACVGASAQEMCGEVNAFTPSLATTSQDNNPSSSSCDVSWSLGAPTNAPAWMRSVEICFHLYHRQNGHCSTIPRTQCAKVNNWTPYFTLTVGDRAVCGMDWSFKTDMV